MRLPRFLLPLFGLLLLSSTLLAQNPLISGQVLDDETGEPLPGAWVKEKGTSNAVLTDEGGYFELRISKESRVVRISFLGYLTREVLLKEGQTELECRLTPGGVQLPTTTITSSPFEAVYPDPQTHVLDYQFLGDDLLVLVRNKKSRKNELEILDESLNRIDVDITLGEEPRGLYKDCLGLVHCLGKEFAWQLDWVENRILARSDSLHLFDVIVRPCEAHLDSTYFYGLKPNVYTQQFIYVRKDELRKKHLYASVDKHAMAIVQDERLMPSRIVSPELLGNPQRPEYTEYGLDPHTIVWMMLPPPYIPIRIVRNQALVFDHLKEQIVAFDPTGKRIGTQAIYYPTGKHWKRHILTDEEQRRAFTMYEHHGYTTLAEIDLEGGNVLKQWTLPKPFVKVIRVKGNHIYFVYQDSQYHPVRKLYRMAM